MENRVKLVGIGDYGCKIVRAFVAVAPYVPDFVCVNTKNHPDGRYDAVAGVTIGAKTTGGFGCGADPQKGKMAAEESKELLCGQLRGYEKVVVVAGLGRGTGSGAATEICRLAKSLGAKTAAVVATPFSFAGDTAAQHANEALAELYLVADEVNAISGEEQDCRTLQQAMERVDCGIIDALTELLTAHEPRQRMGFLALLRKWKNALLLLACVLASAMCALPVMRTTLTAGEAGDLVVRGFNLMSFSPWGCIPLLASLTIPAILLSHQSKAAKELELILLTLGNIVCYVHGFNAARTWLMSLGGSVRICGAGTLAIPLAFVAAMAVSVALAACCKEASV